jgi:lactate dehydrogenase-like 2-hydroxyacid dehydrogenase
VRPKVLVTRRIPQAGLDLLGRAADVVLNPHDRAMTRDELLSSVKDADGLLCLLSDRVDEALFEAAPRLRAVATYSVGFDHIDVKACGERAIAVMNTPGVLTETTADLAWSLMMAAARRLPEGDHYVRAGKWKTWGPMLLMGPDVHGATLGIVGFGRIGQAMARRAKGFGMRIVYHDLARAPKAVEAEYDATFMTLEGLLHEADFVSLHVNLSPETNGLLNAERLGWMKPTAILVNTARGPVVDSMALVEALRKGTIAAAALDVTDPEPLPADHPLVTLDNCLVVPHIASASRATRGKMAAMAAANLLAGLRGERLPTPVNPEVYG